ncbi:ATP-dependent metallopeptidase FtsH/Yme1/Tma family protein [Weissella confusa]|uniref:ATP-dependent metallopeptidase FtsH/Yme1/Tma family protein n=1 Tax=Weissella confusa TaxID=1583 RepID=A0A923NIU4_WEICO|nr:ATP-dependent metallopeptidase FtsH/Yme1/Tma family protein [Weissella confusa]
MMGFGKSKAKPADPSENKVRFADVAGAEEEKQELDRKVQTDKSSKDDSLVSLVGGASNKVTGFETQVISNDPIMESLQKAADKTKTEITTKPEASNFWGNIFVRNSLFYVIVVLGIMGLIYWVAGPSQTTSTKTISTSTFMTELRDKKIKTITIQPGAGVYDVKGELQATVP